MSTCVWLLSSRVPSGVSIILRVGVNVAHCCGWGPMNATVIGVALDMCEETAKEVRMNVSASSAVLKVLARSGSLVMCVSLV